MVANKTTAVTEQRSLHRQASKRYHAFFATSVNMRTNTFELAQWHIRYITNEKLFPEL